MLLVVRDELVQTVDSDDAASHHTIGLFHHPYGIREEIGPQSLVGAVRYSELSEEVALGDVVVRIDVHLLAQRLGDVLTIREAIISDREREVPRYASVHDGQLVKEVPLNP